MLTTILILFALILLRKLVRAMQSDQTVVSLGVLFLVPIFFLAVRLTIKGIVREIVTGVRKDFTDYYDLHKA